jgi:chromosomal replication initiator protein
MAYEPVRVRLPQRVVETPPAPEFEPVRDYLLIAGQWVDADAKPEPPALPAIPIAPHRLILKEVSEKHGIPIVQLVGQQRSRKIVAARHEACYRMAHETRMSLPQIGAKLGGRDHSTIYYGVQCHAKRNGILAWGGGGKPNYCHAAQRDAVLA